MHRGYLAFIFLLLMPIAFAGNMTIAPIVDQISPYEPAVYTLSVTNTNPKTEHYVLSSSDVMWTVTTDPLTDYTSGFDVQPNKTYQTLLLLKPREDAFTFGKHSIEIIAMGKNGDRISDIAGVNIRQDLIKYPVRIIAQIIAPEAVIPGRVTSFRAELDNQNLLNVTNLTVVMNSSVFSKQSVVDLAPGMKKLVDFSIMLDTSTPPKDDTLVLTLMHNNTVVLSISKKYSISSHGIFNLETSTQTSFLKTVETRKYTNNGNAQATEEIIVPVEFSKRPFTYTNPSSNVEKIGEEYAHIVPLTIGPGQSATLIVTQNYRPIIYLIIIIAGIVVLYFLFRPPITMQKEAREVQMSSGGIAALKVVIKLKNRSARQIKDVKVVERIPHIAKLSQHGAETLKPSKIYPFHTGTAMHFDIPRLEPGEIRIISYTMTTKLGVVGDLRISPAIAQFEGKKAYSNPVVVYSP